MQSSKMGFGSPGYETDYTGDPVSILAIVVLYKVSPSDSTTIQTLQEALQQVSPGRLRIQIVLHDNTPGEQDVAVPPGMLYQADPTNSGLSAAYNAALRTANAQGYEWLLTLDQDTELPKHYFSVLLRHIALWGEDSRVGAIVPHIVDGDRPISPFRFWGGFLPIVLPLETSGVSTLFTSALNSASLLRVATLEQINGYDERFPLNNSDTNLFHRLGQAGKFVAVAGDLVVQHELAILNREERMPTDRYRKLLADERAMWDLYMGRLARMERLFRLVGRVIKDRLSGKHEAFTPITIHEVRYRLFTRRRRRVQVWARSVDHLGRGENL